MIKAFNEPDTQNTLLVVLSNEKGLGPADEAVYHRLVDALTADRRDVVMVQDFVSNPALREVMTSKDQKAWYLPVSVAGTLGTPAANESYRRAVDVVTEATAGTALKLNVTGPAATVSDLTAVGERDVHVVEAATALMVLTILLVVYRSFFTMLLPLATIGISLVVAQQIVAGLVQLGLGVSPQAIVLITGLMLGAGTDYAVFLISCYHERLRQGWGCDVAVALALSSIGKVIAASAGTVAITFLGMSFAKLGIFSTIGPALAITVGVGFLSGGHVVACHAGTCRPSRLGEAQTGDHHPSLAAVRYHIVRRPVSHLVASSIVLVLLAGCVALVKFNYDDRKNLPIRPRATSDTR